MFEENVIYVAVSYVVFFFFLNNPRKEVKSLCTLIPTFQIYTYTSYYIIIIEIKPYPLEQETHSVYPYTRKQPKL